MTRARLKIPLLLSAVVGLASACGPREIAPHSPVDAGFTPTAAVVDLPTPTDTPLPTPTSTETPSAPQQVNLALIKNAFCRKGPSVAYFDVGSYAQGDTALALGRNDTEPRWWLVQKPSGEQCWISAVTVEPNEQAESLPVMAPEKPLPETPGDFSVVDHVCKKGGFSIALGWTPSRNADGYHVFLLGEQIQDITNPLQNSYVNVPPMNQPIYYELQAYSRVGYGERIRADDPGCP